MASFTFLFHSNMWMHALATAGYYLHEALWLWPTLSEYLDVDIIGYIHTRLNLDLYYPYVQVRKSLELGNIEAILDPSIKKWNPNMESVWKVAELAIWCVEPKGIHRPFMRDVVRELREAWDLEMKDKKTHSSNSQPTSNSDGYESTSYNNHAPMGPQPSLNEFGDSRTFMGDSETSYPHPR